MPVRHDLECKRCEEFVEDHIFTRPDDVKKEEAELVCPACNASYPTFRIVYESRMNYIHPTHSSMYGKMHYGLGEVIQDRAHKERLLKENNMIEAADAVGGSKDHSIVPQGPRKYDLKDVMWGPGQSDLDRKTEEVIERNRQ